jgi:Holliday junction resolvase RusA-like endonuclease
MGCTMPSVDKSYACLLETATTKSEFFMPMIPPTTTFQQKEIRVVWSKQKKKYIPAVYDSAELKAARSKLQAHLAKHVPAEKYTGAVRLITKWLFPITGKHYDGEYKTTKPDTDNLQKLLKDVMTKLGYWTDDALVVSEIIEKFWADVPGIYIKIEEVN